MSAMKEAMAKAMTEKKLEVPCPYCGKQAEMVKGDVIYPHRPDLFEKNFWQCKPCDAYVGCHEPNPKFGFDGTQPLGRLADAKLRKAKWDAHAVFDPLWRDGHFNSRKHAYRWLSKELGIKVEDCHIGMFDVGQCRNAIAVCRKKLGEQRG